MPDELPYSPAADRNKEPILAVLRQVLGPRGSALEIASGTGQHVARFAQALPDWTWQPSDADEALLGVIAARTAQLGLGNVRPPVLLDLLSPQWLAGSEPAPRLDAVFCANLLHIAPWAACAALMEGAAQRLNTGGVLITYGPYYEDGVTPAPSNLAFDESLQARDPRWGIRRLADVAQAADKAGLALRERHAMPANNLMLVFEASAPR